MFPSMLWDKITKSLLSVFWYWCLIAVSFWTPMGFSVICELDLYSFIYMLTVLFTMFSLLIIALAVWYCCDLQIILQLHILCLDNMAQIISCSHLSLCFLWYCDNVKPLRLISMLWAHIARYWENVLQKM